MTTEKLGQSVKSAIRFVRQIHRDVIALIRSFDEEMGRQGWKPTEKTKVHEDSWKGLNADYWIVRDIFRIYVPQRADADTKQAGVVQISLDPLDLYDEPVVLIAALQYPKATSFADLWNNWELEGSAKVLTKLVEAKGTIDLPAECFKAKFCSDASQGKAFVVPLCDLRSEQDLRQKVVAPLIGLLKTPAVR